MSSLGQNNDTKHRPNICNPDRALNIATMYLAKLLSVDLNNIKSFIFEFNTEYEFPNGSNFATYPPDSLTEFPNLEQLFWTIMNQFTPETEPSIRNNKSPLWCWYTGYAVFDHCKATYQRKSCGQEADSHCKQIWKNFLEGCHRVRSINPVGEYGFTNNVNRWCMSDAGKWSQYL